MVWKEREFEQRSDRLWFHACGVALCWWGWKCVGAGAGWGPSKLAGLGQELVGHSEQPLQLLLPCPQLMMEQSKKSSLMVARSILNNKLISKKLERYLKVRHWSRPALSPA